MPCCGMALPMPFPEALRFRETWDSGTPDADLKLIKDLLLYEKTPGSLLFL